MALMTQCHEVTLCILQFRMLSQLSDVVDFGSGRHVMLCFTVHAQRMLLQITRPELLPARIITALPC